MDVVMTSEAAEYERLFREIVRWASGGEQGILGCGYTRDHIVAMETNTSPVGPFMHIRVTNYASPMTRGVLAYLRPDKRPHPNLPGNWFGYMCRCDVRGGGRREWTIEQSIEFIRALHAETVGKKVPTPIQTFEEMKPPDLWIPMSDPVDQAVIGKLAEELAECSAIVARIMIQGIDGVDPDRGTLNRKSLEDEMADVRAMIDLAVERFISGRGRLRMADRTLRKEAHKREWHRMLREHFKTKSEPKA